jgi:hypothetical protein
VNLMARFNRLQNGNSDRTQTSTQEGLDALERSSLGPASKNGAIQASNGAQTVRKTIKANTPTLIPHKLGRPYRGWNVALKDQGVSIYCPSGETYDKSKFICVKTDPGSADVEAEFWVF